MNTTKIINKELLQTRQHFVILDGLRGIAALSIVVFHFMEWIFTDYSQNFIGHGFLAVDFFFCLSGFVIGYAYDNRIEKMGVLEFFKSRLIRLHPLVILGSVLGLLGYLFDPFAVHSAPFGAGNIILLFLCSICLIPLPIMEERSYNLFSFNAPAWSLFWEYIANILYAVVLYKISRRSLIVLTTIAAVVLCYVGYKANNLLGGWSHDTFWDGGARVFYSFSAGLLVYRANWIIKNRVGFVGLALMLLAAFLMPYIAMNWLAEVLVVLLYFPLIVSLGAGSHLSPRMPSVCELSGNLSYPLYMTHYGAIWIFSNYYINYHPSPTELCLIVIFGTLLLVGIAYIVLKVFDIPVRRYLTAKRKERVVE